MDGNRGICKKVQIKYLKRIPFTGVFSFSLTLPTSASVYLEAFKHNVLSSTSFILISNVQLLHASLKLSIYKKTGAY